MILSFFRYIWSMLARRWQLRCSSAVKWWRFAATCGPSKYLKCSCACDGWIITAQTCQLQTITKTLSCCNDFLINLNLHCWHTHTHTHILYIYILQTWTWIQQRRYKMLVFCAMFFCVCVCVLFVLVWLTVSIKGVTHYAGTAKLCYWTVSVPNYHF